LDPRIHPWRPDLADERLRGRVEAKRFVAGTPHRVAVGSAPMTGSPDATARRTSEVLFGEPFTLFEAADGWAWGQNGTDGYVGYVPLSALGEPVGAPTHRVSALRSFLYPDPDLKTPPRDALSLGSAVTVVGQEGNWCAVAGGGWVFGKHLVPVGQPAAPQIGHADPAATARRLLGVPYLWGGRTSLGIDCSGLVQLALGCAGIPAPRDSDQQRASVGTLVSPDGAGVAYRRGDIVFFPGHVGIMEDDTRLIHATAFTMSVTVEPLSDVVARVDPTRGGGILAVRRPGVEITA
jgi:cell wall-associated NlpC family hydrolase